MNKLTPQQNTELINFLKTSPSIDNIISWFNNMNCQLNAKLYYDDNTYDYLYTRAIINNNTELLRHLCDINFDFTLEDSNGWNIFHNPPSDTKLWKQILDICKSYDPDFINKYRQDSSGYGTSTLLHIWCMYYNNKYNNECESTNKNDNIHYKMIEFLLENGANPLLKNIPNSTNSIYPPSLQYLVAPRDVIVKTNPQLADLIDVLSIKFEKEQQTYCDLL